jgi:N-acetylglutamate synthase-like GNAT family acetyltransferase
MIVKSPITRDDFKAYYELRYKVLRQPWGLPRGSEKDDYEPISQHFMAVNEETGELLGCVKLFEKEASVAWVSHLAVSDKHQREGIGKMMLAHVEALARSQGFTRIGCLSRLNTTDYFEKAGYIVSGLPTHYFGTTQVVWMEKQL